MKGSQGYFIGRLLRTRLTTKETKDGFITVFVMGLIDLEGQMLRANLVGKMAVKQHKELKKKKCYYLRGFEVFQSQRMLTPHIRVKEKDFKVKEVQHPKINEALKMSYYNWDH